MSTCQNSGFRSGVEEDISRYSNDFSTEQVLNKKFCFDQSETPAFVLWRMKTRVAMGLLEQNKGQASGTV
ncbi:hypothetical protein ACSBR2_034177 [Camellia fascicularis]